MNLSQLQLFFSSDVDLERLALASSKAISVVLHDGLRRPSSKTAFPSSAESVLYWAVTSVNSDVVVVVVVVVCKV